MLKKLKSIKPLVAAFLSLLLLLTGFIPMGGQIAKAAAGSIIVTSIPSGEGTQSTPYIHYASKITISGSYGVDIEGENLRLRVVTNNGSSVEDLPDKPVIDKASFTFSFKEISLKPGLNKISFFENTGDITKSLHTIFVQYNNTPVLTDIELNSTPLGSNPTVVGISSNNNLSLSLSGKAVNADSVKVTNNTTGETFIDDVSQSGSFSADIDMQLGYNELDIQAYNSNKEVMLLKKSVIVTVTGGKQGTADQFFNVTLAGKKLDPSGTNSLVGATSGNFNLSGSVLMQVPAGIYPFASLDASSPPNIVNNDFTDTVILRDVTSNAVTITPTVYGTPTYDPIKRVDLPGSFRQYDNGVTATLTVPAANPLIHGHTYELVNTYKFVKETVSNGITTRVADTATIESYIYKFVFLDASQPSFGDISLANEGNKKVILGETPNPFKATPLKLSVDTNNMATTSQLKIYYNNGATPLASTDYTISYDAATGKYTITLDRIPATQTIVTLDYNSGAASVSFVLKPEVSPFVQLFYYDSNNKEEYIDSGLQFTSAAQVPTFYGKLVNYPYASGVTITLNNDDANPLTHTANATTTDINDFKINPITFVEGNNTLKIKLNGEPSAVFTYKFVFTTSKAPKITDLKVQIEQNKELSELKKKSTDAAYSTSAFFLAEFTFDVEDASEVNIRKDGNIIAEFEPNGTGWKPKSTPTTDYTKARDKAIEGDSTSTLGNIYTDNNFSYKSGAFIAEMSSKEYGDDLLDRLEEIYDKSDALEDKLKLFPLTLSKGGSTTYEIEAIEGNVITRQKITIIQQSNSWTVLSPTKLDNAQYATVNSNTVPIRIFAENANKVTFGKIEAVAHNTDKPDFKYDEKLGKSLPETYYVFEANVPLKAGLNTVKFTVEVGDQKYNDQVLIYNVNSTVNGAESRDTFGKKLSFSVFEKALELKFPTGTVLLAPSNNREGKEVKVPQSDIFTDITIYFGIADRTNGRVNIEDDGLEDDMQDLLRIGSEFNYASPLYFIDAGNAKAGSVTSDRAPGGRDPYFEGEVNGMDLEPFVDRWEENLVPSKNGTLAIKYDPAIVNAANTTITVFYNNGDEWINLGGVVNTGKKTVTVPFKGFGYYLVMKTRESFSDVIKHDFARDAIETLYAKGIMNEAPGNGFGTELKINRGEFATMIVKALDLPINAGPYRDNNENDPSEPTFRDVDPSDDDWDYEYKYIETAARAGIIRGKDTRAFFPEDSLTREEAAIIISRALNLKLTGSPELAQSNLAKLFTDGKDVGYYGAQSVLAVTKAKLMNGEPEPTTDPKKKQTFRFNPKGDLTRAEMAVITIRIMVQLKKLPKQ